ncbi:uncharacterized protein CTRU02_207426 [Colletotrichum truncatum]|uniref:Uncharacterized protein n=1 Tax=Colletotrichum truncatum TaxID=5467 RepID=A0ACC3Z0U8_COLTU|nr:uncharacterized protein CTRU02_00942 [Colletotrichum truncatum]KAF6800537.1 hypothetical protein CTRU02_00942 [Colletotrichum truncatum]
MNMRSFTNIAVVAFLTSVVSAAPAAHPNKPITTATSITKDNNSSLVRDPLTNEALVKYQKSWMNYCYGAEKIEMTGCMDLMYDTYPNFPPEHTNNSDDVSIHPPKPTDWVLHSHATNGENNKDVKANERLVERSEPNVAAAAAAAARITEADNNAMNYDEILEYEIGKRQKCYCDGEPKFTADKFAACLEKLYHAYPGFPADFPHDVNGKPDGCGSSFDAKGDPLTVSDGIPQMTPISLAMPETSDSDSGVVVERHG